MLQRIDIIPGRTYACGCDIQPGQQTCATHGAGIAAEQPLFRVSYPERGRTAATGMYFNREKCEETLRSFRSNGKAWLQESSDSGRTWRTLDV